MKTSRVVSTLYMAATIKMTVHDDGIALAFESEPKHHGTTASDRGSGLDPNAEQLMSLYAIVNHYRRQLEKQMRELGMNVEDVPTGIQPEGLA